MAYARLGHEIDSLKLSYGKKEQIEKINIADSLIFQTEKQLKEYGDKLSPDNKSNIETALAGLKTAHEAKDIEQIDKATEGLNSVWQAASQEMYKAQSEGAQPGPDAEGSASGNGQSGNAGTDQVTDVEFEEVTDKK